MKTLRNCDDLDDWAASNAVRDIRERDARWLRLFYVDLSPAEYALAVLFAIRALELRNMKKHGSGVRLKSSRKFESRYDVRILLTLPASEFWRFTNDELPLQ